MHPALFAKFGGNIQLSQKFHPKITGKFNTSDFEHLTQMTPNNLGKGKGKEVMLLQGPVQPKPPSFFEQAYQGKEDYRKLARAKSANRPYSAYRQDDTQSYMSHHKLKQVEGQQRKTIDNSQFTRSKRSRKGKKLKTKPKNCEY